MSAVPPATASRGPAVLLLDSASAHLFRADRADRPVRAVASLALDDTGDGRNADLAGALAERLGPFLVEHGVTTVAVGLPVAWTEQLVLETPPLRGLDLLGLVQRDVARQSHLPANDLLLAHVDEGSKAGSSTTLRLVSAARESAVLALVQGLSRHRVAVSSVVAAPLVALLRAIDELVATDGSDTDARAIVFARRFGFAVAVHVGSRVVQLRVLGVSVPTDPEHLATVLTEEVRRSCMYFRERNRGQDVCSVRVVGHVPTDPDGVRAALEQGLGMPASIDASDGADHPLEAQAILAMARNRRSKSLELLPPELGHRRAGRLRGLAAAALVLATIGSAGFTAKRCGDEARHTASEVARIESDRRALEADVARHAEVLADVQEHIARRDLVQQLVNERMDLAAIMAELATVVPEIARITSIRSRSFEGESAVVDIMGRVAAGDFEADECVHALMSRLTQDLGARCRLIELSAMSVERSEQFEFVVEAEWPREGEVLDESP